MQYHYYVQWFSAFVVPAGQLPCEYKWVHSGRVCQDRQTLSQQNVGNDAKLHMVQRSRGMEPFLKILVSLCTRDVRSSTMPHWDVLRLQTVTAHADGKDSGSSFNQLCKCGLHLQFNPSTNSNISHAFSTAPSAKFTLCMDLMESDAGTVNE